MIIQIIDSTTIQHLASTGLDVLTLTNNTIIPNVPNEITGGLITMIIGIIIRFFEKRHLLRKMNDGR